jgi:hypothetical protein
MIIASSKRKGLGPKKGSECYIGNKISTRVFVNYGFIATVFDTFFSRYGFEKKFRNEKRKMIFVFPIANKSLGDEEAQIKSLIKRIHSPKSASVWNEVRKEFNTNHLASQIAVAVPAVNTITNLNNVEDDEFHAWFDSIFSSLEFGHFVYNLTKTGYHTTSEDSIISDTYIVRSFKNILSADRQKKRLFLANVFENFDPDKRRQTFVEMVSMFMAFKNGQKDNKIMLEVSMTSMFQTLVNMVRHSSNQLSRSDVVNVLYNSEISNFLFEGRMLNMIYAVFLNKYKQLEGIQSLVPVAESVLELRSVVSEEIEQIHKLSCGLVGLSSRLLVRHR